MADVRHLLLGGESQAQETAYLTHLYHLSLFHFTWFHVIVTSILMI